MEGCNFCSGCLFTEDTTTSKDLYEIHITVETDNIPKFKSDCLLNNIKPIVIDFQDKNNFENTTHVMTSNRVKGSFIDMKKEHSRIVNVFQKLGYNMIRNKIETTLGNDSALKVMVILNHIFLLEFILVCLRF